MLYNNTIYIITIYSIKKEVLMKKIILILLIVFSLNASELVCKNSYERFQKYTKLFYFASERKDYRNMKINADMEILYAEKALVNCPENWKNRKHVLKIRKTAIEISKALEKFQ